MDNVTGVIHTGKGLTAARNSELVNSYNSALRGQVLRRQPDPCPPFKAHRLPPQPTPPFQMAKGPVRPPRPSAEIRSRMPMAIQLASMKLPP